MLSIFYLLGCTQPFTDTAEVFSGDETDAGDNTSTGDDLDEQTEGLEADPGCDGFDGQPIPGATSYFLGDFSISNKVVTGTERWALLANDAWKRTGSDDCVATWSVSGTAAEPTATCGSCDYSLDITASLDVSLTTCPKELWEGDEQFAVTYNVKLIDGSSIFYFASSGNELATGTGSAAGASYLTESTCVFF